jgi:hypothetical protein
MHEDDLTRSRPGSATADVRRPPSSSGIDHGRFLPGAVIGDRYRVVAMLGRGGMGEVYRADDLKVGQPVALKFLPPRFAQDPERLARLMGEVRAARQVAHPNVCHVYDVAEVGGEHFISMEMVQGEDLATLLRRIGRLPGDKALQIARQLCAGLAAAHAKGLLHRDLKPANVMLDERGAVRIMDFGLAGAHFEGDAVREGTPAYMAPEQLAGRGVGVASDVYALGLVLYELFTGRHPFGSGGSVAALIQQREQTTPAPLTNHVEGIDEATERAILRCLEKEPALRPSSATAVAAALPGGDPLAAALAAGETPSPDMVAASGGEGSLSATRAWTLLLTSVALVCVVIALWPWSSDLGSQPLPRSRDALDDRAREVLSVLGHEGAGDETSWFDRNYAYLLFEAGQPEPVRRIEAWPGAGTYVYRRSPRALVPFASATVTAEDPPLAVSGMANVRLVPTGGLLDFVIVPPEYDESPGPWPEPDWTKVLALTGLDTAVFRPTEPRWTPPVACDVRRAWIGKPWPDRPELRIEAAAFHGRPVAFAVLGPWIKPTSTAIVVPEGARGGLAPSASVVVQGGGWRFLARTVLPNVLIVVVGATVVALARRNLMLGRGDRRGAGRIAAAVASMSLVTGVFQTHHVTDPTGEWRLFLATVAFGVFWAGYVWLSYVALEPYLRRRWPTLLVGWTRVLSGRFADPLVGRDILVGAAFGALVAVVYHVANALPAWAPFPGQTPINTERVALAGPGGLVSLVANVMTRSIIQSLVIVGILFVGHLATGRSWAAGAITAGIIMLLQIGAENLSIEWVVAACIGTLSALVVTRYGVLSLAAMSVVYHTLLLFPLTLELGRWYAGGTVVALTLLAALLVYGFRVALGGRPAFAIQALAD